MSKSTLLLIVALLAAPYVVDVGYYGDFTPTHFSQANLIEDDHLDDVDLFSSHDHYTSDLIGILRSHSSVMSKQDDVSTHTSYTPLGYPTSRPPPYIHLS